MNRLRTLALILALSTAVPVLPACSRPTTIVTPEGKAAWTADQIVLRVNRLMRVAADAEKGGALPTATAKIIITFGGAADRVLKTTPTGWHQTVTQLWAEAKKQMPATTNEAVLAAMDAVDIVLAAL